MYICNYRDFHSKLDLQTNTDDFVHRGSNMNADYVSPHQGRETYCFTPCAICPQLLQFYRDLFKTLQVFFQGSMMYMRFGWNPQINLCHFFRSSD